MTTISHRGGLTASTDLTSITVSDQTTLIAAIAELGTGGGQINIGPGTFPLTETIRIHGVAGLTIACQGTLFTWAGSASSRMFEFDQCQDCTLQNCRIKPGNTIAEIVRIWDTDTHANHQRSSRVHLHRVIMQFDNSECAIGIYIKKDFGGKNDYHSFTEVQVQRYTYAACVIEGQSARGITFNQCLLQGRDIGLYAIDTATIPGDGGSFFVHEGEVMEHQEYDFRIGDRSGPCKVSGTWFEQSVRLLSMPDYYPGVGSQREMNPVVLDGIRWGTRYPPADGRIVDFRGSGPLVITGCQFGTNTPGLEHECKFHVEPRFGRCGFVFDGNAVHTITDRGHFTGRWPDSCEGNYGSTQNLDSFTFELPPRLDQGIEVPVYAPDWTLLGVPVPSQWYIMQEADDAAAVYSLQRRGEQMPLVLRDTTPPVLGATNANWDGTVVSFTQDANQQLSLNDVDGLFNPQTTSVAMLLYATFTAGDPEDAILVLGNGANGVNTGPVLRFGASGKLKILANGVTDNGAAIDYRDGLPHPVLFTYNRTAGTMTVYTDAEGTSPIVGTYTTSVADTEKRGVGADRLSLISFEGTARLFAVWRGPDAEAVDNVNTLRRLGWTVS